MTPDDLRLIRGRCEEGTDTLAVADRRSLLAELDCIKAQAPQVKVVFAAGALTTCQVRVDDRLIFDGVDRTALTTKKVFVCEPTFQGFSDRAGRDL